jgi:mevalonate kinase
MDRIGEIVLEGAEAIQTRDKKRLGALMRENHELLNSLGVGHESLEKLVSACQETAYGAKLTGAGGGGSMIALTDDPKATSEAIRVAGGEPITVRVGVQGVRVEKR